MLLCLVWVGGWVGGWVGRTGNEGDLALEVDIEAVDGHGEGGGGAVFVFWGGWVGG